MGRTGRWVFIAALGAVALASSARADDDDTLKALVADCSGPDVKSSDVDSCLERARAMGESDPSPQLQGLTANLERIAERQQDESDAAKTAAASPATTAQSGGGIPAGSGVSADNAAPHGNMH